MVVVMVVLEQLGVMVEVMEEAVVVDLDILMDLSLLFLLNKVEILEILRRF
jgi:hypothetical protein